VLVLCTRTISYLALQILMHRYVLGKYSWLRVCFASLLHTLCIFFRNPGLWRAAAAFRQQDLQIWPNSLAGYCQA
jgi:hypothetical protein